MSKKLKEHASSWLKSLGRTKKVLKVVKLTVQDDILTYQFKNDQIEVIKQIETLVVLHVK